MDADDLMMAALDAGASCRGEDSYEILTNGWFEKRCKADTYEPES